MKRPENETKTLDEFFDNFEKFDDEIKKIIQEYFTINNIINIDGSQPLENILHCLQKKVTVQGHFQYGRNVLPERVIISNQAVQGNKIYNFSLLKYIKILIITIYTFNI